MSRRAVLSCLLAPALFAACASREPFPEIRSTPGASCTAESYLELGRHLEAREAAQRELEDANHRGDAAAALGAQVRLGEALVGLEEHALARGYLVDILRNVDASLREDARALLALSHDREGHHALARSYYDEVRRDRVTPELWSRITRSLSRYVLAGPASGRGAVRPPTATVPTAAILPRARWRPEPLRQHLANRMEAIRKITVHHTGMLAQPMSVEEVAQLLRAIQQEHFRRGWADIGYHYVVDPAGRAWECRPIAYQGAHAGNHDLNRGNIGVSMMGDFNSQPVPEAQRRGLAALLAELAIRHNVPRSQILSHGIMRATDCPGRYAEAILPALIRELPLDGAPRRLHRVTRGDTLARIARHYGVSLGSLRSANPGASDDLQPGDMIAVP
ncbi:MAG: N-acetylmuramoyl-L-alanine amidase [Planctomycetes bacterium]|nr:N-acetylmuramoyl-L-alanine amidase [Planctomycetota bacterium]